LAIGSSDFAPTQKPATMMSELTAGPLRDWGDARRIHYVKEGFVGFVEALRSGFIEGVLVADKRFAV
jgi:hypothetical protein